jgi:hypothetical protein
MGRGAKDKLIVVVGTSAPSMADGFRIKPFRTPQELSLHNVTIKKAIAGGKKVRAGEYSVISYKEENRIITERPKIYETDSISGRYSERYGSPANS